ncbi:VWA domain-containing protein [Pseudomonas neustonica]|uniref:VWA domain-containing protein n=1 Tax=Pseudomonas neustonica TaxID=2487346 RepID=A0ABX9XMH7_9PSED|nr:MULTISPECIES: VWA domain-containing protein [Pseudomonas]ROZ83925.1 VWA domain-containing protein [Pseudomonas sp. SSM44]ROZ85848.1 VWA domain-containing protein [Pseudomonas neustonica]
MLLDLLPFSFSRPWWLLALLPNLFLCWYLFRHMQKHSGWEALLPANLRKALLQQQQGRRYVGRYLLLGLCWTLALLALSGPAWESDDGIERSDQGALVVVLQVSRSMLSTDLAPNRLDQARRKVQDVMRNFPEKRVALIAYAGSAHLVAPLTHDHSTLLNLLGALHPDIMPVRGQQADQALALAQQLVRDLPPSSAQVLLLTNGLNDSEQSLADVVTQDLGPRLRVLGIGTADGAPVPIAEGGFMRDEQGRILLPQLDERALSHFAHRHGGEYASLTWDDQDLNALLADTPASDQVAEQSQRQWLDQGHWLLLLLLPLAAIGARRGWLALLLIALWLPPPASAMGWQDLWQRPDQQAAKLMAEGNPAAAAQRFEDPQWQAWAHLQAGDYAAASSAYGALAAAEPDNPEYHFAQGTALALDAQYQAALNAFEQALIRAPEHTAARHNRKRVEAYLAELEKAEQQEQGKEQEQPGASDESQQQSDDAANTTTSEQAVTTENDTPKAGSEQSASAGNSATADQNTSANAETTPGTTPDGLMAQNPAASEDDESQDDESLLDSAPAEGGTSASSISTGYNAEQQQALQQWLRDIPDNPSELLRRKFLYQHLQQPDGRPR